MREALAQIPRLSLTRTPTPLHRLGNLSRYLGVDVYFKRDDLTDLGLGGDKARKLEYELARAVADGCNWVVSCGSSQSNFARLLSAAARRIGLGCSLVLGRGQHPEDQGNLLAVRLMGVEVEMVDVDDLWDLEDHCQRVCTRLREAGLRPYYVPVSGTTAHSCLGYVGAGFELAEQFRAIEMTPDALYAPFGTGGIVAGLAIALRDCGYIFPIIAASVNRPADACRDMLKRWLADVPPLLGGASLDSTQVRVEIRDDQRGAQYGMVTTGCLDALALCAESEGILLDPVYSAKVAATLIADCRSRRWAAGSRILMLHSGGVPAIFAYHREISLFLASRRSTGGFIG